MSASESPFRRLVALPARMPLALRWTLVGLSLCLVFWLSLSPSDSTPTVSLSDKVQHALAFLLLTVAYGLMFPARPYAVLAGVAGLGVAIELLQAALPYGRRAEFADLAADLIGIGAGFVLLWVLAGRRKLPT